MVVVDDEGQFSVLLCTQCVPAKIIYRARKVAATSIDRHEIESAAVSSSTSSDTPDMGVREGATTVPAGREARAFSARDKRLRLVES